MMWVKEEIKYLHANKADLNVRLYRTHLELLGSIINSVIQTINNYIKHTLHHT